MEEGLPSSPSPAISLGRPPNPNQPSLSLSLPSPSSSSSSLPSPSSSWRNLFSKNSSKPFTNLTYHSEVRGKKVSITESDVAKEIQYWKNSVIGYVMGKRPYYHRFKGFVEKRWAKKVTVCYLKDSFFIVRFESKEEVVQTLSRIHMFEGRPIILKQWDKNVNLSKEVLDSVLVWLRLHNLLVHCHDAESVSKVCSNFSKPIYMDDPELHRDKGDYVRVMVEVGVKEVLPESTIVDIHGCDCYVDLEYEWKPTLCGICKKVDHLEDRCPSKVLNTKPQKGVDKWVVKNKGKKIVVDEVFDTMPVRVPAPVIHEVVQVSNAFAVLEETEAPGIASEERVVEDVDVTVVLNLDRNANDVTHADTEDQVNDTVITDEIVIDTENITQLGLDISAPRTELISTHASFGSVGGDDSSTETTPGLG